jgi:hypothetical protein
MRGAVLAAAERSDVVALAQVAHDEQGDTLYAIDRVSEERMLAWCEEEIARLAPCVVIAEGLSGGRITLPRGVDETQARFRILIDPLDGTRGLMYQKRSAWILTGVAPNRGAATTLADIELAVQTEVPLLKQHLCDTLWALRGRGAQGERFDLVRGAGAPLTLRPSQADTIAHGFAMIARFFPGMREELAAIDEEIVRGALGPARRGKAHCFEDQYISTGGQLYELMAGHDRFVADLRPLIEPLLASRGLALGICCHPYDLATELIARELGVIVVDPFGAPLSAPLTVEAEVAWAGYANAAIRAQIEPLLQAALRRRGLAPSSDGRHLRAEPQAG